MAEAPLPEGRRAPGRLRLFASLWQSGLSSQACLRSEVHRLFALQSPLLSGPARRLRGGSGGVRFPGGGRSLEARLGHQRETALLAVRFSLDVADAPRPLGQIRPGAPAPTPSRLRAPAGRGAGGPRRLETPAARAGAARAR